MFCVIQEIEVKKVHAGEPREIEVYETTWTTNDKKKSTWGWRYSNEHFDRPVRKAYRISIHESYREAGKVKKKQTVICTIEYYSIVDWGSWIGDYITDSRWKDKVETIGLPENELVDLIYKKFQSIIDRVESEFQQTEEYRAREEHRRILKEHNQRVAEFKEKYDASESQYNDCYDVFGNLRSPDALKKIKADYKAKRDYERRSQEESRGYYERFFNNHGGNSGSSYGNNFSNNHNEDNKAMLKKFYRTLSKTYHPDSNPGMDTSEEMKLLNQLKSEWGL
ncbi:hypothetical protein [Enterocloster clostridioformis]|uniref:J domain-containing protein n=1 Tax=Enterocloster clostridioformis TaxID=1531 RepID=A0A1I0K7T3_9FIRM|nr:hypothetical protein [Enterocloster clostridioformis]SEU19733.1 hypothetical protein SAMN05216521_10977 [Enterocloster clostridioformis]SEW49087.1 hypothetical protein SAMN05216528_10927 [Enterocloster clostridioformis]